MSDRASNPIDAAQQILSLLQGTISVEDVNLAHAIGGIQGANWVVNFVYSYYGFLDGKKQALDQLMKTAAWQSLQAKIEKNDATIVAGNTPSQIVLTAEEQRAMVNYKAFCFTPNEEKLFPQYYTMVTTMTPRAASMTAQGQLTVAKLVQAFKLHNVSLSYSGPAPEGFSEVMTGGDYRPSFKKTQEEKDKDRK
jgi:hypothetical protein